MDRVDYRGIADEAEARDNARKITRLLEAQDPGQYADLYRTIVAGPTGQRPIIRVGRIAWRESGPDDFEIRDPADGELVGYARRTPYGEWSMTEVGYHGDHSWRGYASSLSVGCDVLTAGEQPAVGRYDSRRISGGYIRKGSEDPEARAS